MIILPNTDSELRGYLERLGDAVFDYSMLQGFLFAIACSPEPIEASEWFDLVWLNDEPQFNTDDEAKHFFKLLTEFYDDIEQGMAQRRYLPMACPGTVFEQRLLGRWCEGFLFAHYYLGELWELTLSDLSSDELDEAVGSVLNLATTFLEIFDSEQLNFEAMLEEPEMSQDQLQNAFHWFEEVLGLYATTKAQWEMFSGIDDAEQLFLALEPVARDQPCPCGSGLVFAKCCLH